MKQRVYSMRTVFHLSPDILLESGSKFANTIQCIAGSNNLLVSYFPSKTSPFLTRSINPYDTNPSEVRGMS